MNQYNQINQNQHNNNNNNQQYKNEQYNEQQHHESHSNQSHGGYQQYNQQYFNQQYNEQYDDEYKEPKYDDSYNQSQHNHIPYIEPYDESAMTKYSPSTTSILQHDDHQSNSNSNSNEENNKFKFNQYHPKAKEEFIETKKKHIYNIKAHFENNILSIEVYDAYQRSEFRNEFTQKCFPNAQIYNIAKVLVEAVNSLYYPGKKKKPSINRFEPITIYEYNNWCYVTVNGADIPSFALRPIQIAQN